METRVDIPSLVLAARSGEAGARTALVLALAPQLRAAAAEVLDDDALAEDVAQEWLAQHLDDVVALEPHGRAGGYARRAVRNRAVDHWRRTRREQPLPSRTEWEDEGLGAQAMLEVHQELAVLREGVASLREPDRTLLREFYGEDRSYQELAERHGLSASTVKRILGACRLRLARRLLGDGGIHGP